MTQKKEIFQSPFYFLVLSVYTDSTFIKIWCSGSTTGFDPVSVGSSPAILTNDLKIYIAKECILLCQDLDKQKQVNFLRRIQA